MEQEVKTKALGNKPRDYGQENLDRDTKRKKTSTTQREQFGTITSNFYHAHTNLFVVLFYFGLWLQYIIL
jgi:hypothetical protein